MSSALKAALGACVFIACACEGEEAPSQISDSSFGAFEVSLATTADNMGIAWYDTRDGNAEIYLRLLDANAERSSEYRLTDTRSQSYEASIEAVGGEIAVAWYEKSISGELSARLGVWNTGDDLKWSQLLSANGGQSRNPALASYLDRLFCTWIERDYAEQEYVWAAWWDVTGKRLMEPVRLGPASATTWNLNSAIDEHGTAFVVFDAVSDTTAEELFVARLRDGGATLMRLTTDDGYRSKYPDLAFSSTSLALTWFDERDGNSEVYLYVSPNMEFGD